MKKILAVLLTAVLLVSAMAITTFAATDVEFSAKGAEGKPGDTVEVKVYLDKNPGTWCSMFHVTFNSRYFTLLSVENGDVYTNSEFAKAPLTTNGYYRYYAEPAAFDKANTNTGLILTLTFEISKACPNGAHDIKVEFPQNGVGWFFDWKDFSDFTVSCTDQAAIVVTGSDATEPLDTNKDGEVIEPEDTKPETGIHVTEAVTDSKGEEVTNDDGSVMTQVVTDTAGNDVYYETDKEGEIVTNDSGEKETVASTTKAPVTTSPEQKEKEEKENTLHKGIIIAAIVAVVVGAVIIIIVLTKKEKKGDIPAEDKAPENDNKEE